MTKTKNKKPKVKINEAAESVDGSDLPVIIPEPHYLKSKYMVRLPVSDEHFNDPWQLRLYASKLVERKLGDEVQVTSLKVRKPHLISKTVARVRKREPEARMYLTIAF